MRKLTFALFAVVAIAACNSNGSSTTGNNVQSTTATVTTKPAPSVQALADDKLIKAYLTTNKIDAKKDSASGIYYQIITQGTGANATLASTVNVEYAGKLLNGTEFDKSTGIMALPLSRMISGWQIGIPLVKAGGKILLIIPSGLGYGADSPSEKIPPNSVLVFTVDVHGIG
ncbi:FKBP-type peptidyl-prolyl cis-trans isomerase FkpA [Mucilaginibacter gracilis]|uniref:Peptidyl-prolyl cis-trans isomerase n=1 Tax=Mucilaginibacter gracilis TaxID=423350 RepID=A0A495IXP5_9SPHI|nr:FKBP-type peptidyl-prolyl cis-trans isomerase [Mucilaginibacter gracilis]RKR80824.1 FKBP-type peptidyl-prolyl cis-trans isomerase FkpA [Mucilaginibacter gracilis]